MSSGEINKPTIIMAKNDPVTGLPFRPETGGLFDPAKTGGLAGTNWNHISLHEPVVNTLFEKPIRVLLDLKQDDFNKIAEGTKTVTVNGKNLTGGLAIKEMLNKINPEKHLRDLQSELAVTKSLTKKDTIIKKIKYLRPLVDNGFHPSDAYVLSKIPVIPPIYRPVYPDEKGKTVVSDANNLYKEMIENNNKLKSDYIQAVGNDHPDKIALYKSLHNVAKKIQGFDGTADELNFSNREPQGFLKTIVGSNAKYGYFQGKLLAKRQDISGSAIIAPDPKYHLDECGIPEGMAWTMYGPHVIGKLSKLGYTLPQASNAIEKRLPIAKNILLTEMKERPVIINRAPTLHKFNQMSFFPNIVQGKQLLLPPLMFKSQGMDADGDRVTVHLPVTEAGKKEAVENLLPSKNLFNPLNKMPMHVPDQETIIGLHQITDRAQSTKTHNFKTHADVIKAYQQGKIHVTDKIVIGV
jgi:DNA-directed RNA polymerase subunit beta'